MSNRYTIYADDVTKEFTFGLHKNLPGVEGFVRQAVQIVKYWPDLLSDVNVTDGINYVIAYDDGVVSREVQGVCRVPEDFGNLLKLIRKYNPDADLLIAEEQARILSRLNFIEG